jgi:uncharacterized protein (DUF488 family)
MVFTIGYAGTTLPRFLDILKSHKITHLLDVRSLPKSQYFTAFNDSALGPELKRHGIAYLNPRIELGARQTDQRFFTDGQLDFDKFAASPQFHKGMEMVKAIVDSGGTPCLMCAEIDPINCHRAILCARHLATCFSVGHIIAKRNGETTIESHAELGARLVTLCKTDSLDSAYKIQSKQIAFKISPRR